MTHLKRCVRVLFIGALLCHSSVSAQEPALRTSDELTVLYTTAILYGLGTSAWLALQIKPSEVTGALLPFATLAPAGALLIALTDRAYPMRRGIPHAIAAGMYLGFGEGLWLTAFQAAYAARHAGVERWHGQRASTAMWLGATAGGVAGAFVGAIQRPTPGRVSFTSSAAIWTGALAAFAAHALEPNDRRRDQTGFAVGALAYNVGLVGGIVLGPVIAPSVMRARYVDLGGLCGTLLVGGGYALIAHHADSRAMLGLAAVGGVLGLAATSVLTADMLPDHSNDQLPPVFGQRPSRAGLQPLLSPERGGFVAGLRGEL
jgi:hypothetical protein